MISTATDALLDLSGYRHIAAYTLALVLLHRSRGRVLGLKLGSRRDADWLAERLHRQGYAVTAVEPQGTQAILKIARTI